jgi:flagella basal body P-ring formation protein FlgA
MLMPQSSAFTVLKTRLSCVPGVALPNPSNRSKALSAKDIKENTFRLDELLSTFESVQRQVAERTIKGRQVLSASDSTLL